MRVPVTFLFLAWINFATSSPPGHEKVHAQTINPPTTPEEGEINSVAIKEWLSHTTPIASSETTDDVITLANSVSAPWRDAALAGLPPALAYDWKFLINVAAKFKTATGGDNSEKTGLKYLLNRISNKPLKSISSIDGLKIDHHSKSKKKDNIHDPFLWAWKRVSQ